MSVVGGNAYLEQMSFTVEFISSLHVFVGSKADLIPVFINVGEVHLRWIEVEFFLDELRKNLVVDLPIENLDDLVVLESNLHVFLIIMITATLYIYRGWGTDHSR